MWEAMLGRGQHVMRETRFCSLSPLEGCILAAPGMCS